MSNRDEAREFSESRLWESNRRMFDVEGANRLVSEARKVPRRCVEYSPLTPLWKSASRIAVENCAAGVAPEESAGGEDVATEGVDSGLWPLWSICGPCCLACGDGWGIIFGGGFSIVRTYCTIKDAAQVSDTVCKDQRGGCVCVFLCTKFVWRPV